MKMINVIIADDHALFVEGLTALLQDAPHIQFVGTAGNGCEALLLAQQHPDAHLMIMDISMPEMDGIQAMKELRKQKCPIPVMALSQNDDGGSISRAVKAGFDGYILKTASRHEFVEAIQTVAGGDQFFSPEAKDALIFSLSGRERPGKASLTKREEEILRLIANEFTSNEIAEQLYISPYTVETHRKNLIQKLGVRNLAGLVRYAVEHGLTEE